ncbi:hypothetical protein F441_19520 [Phytophthora nicotianae CJ01A1]|uniref:Uncharacterized protein n=1 Tax=Phytophthora nicotianae CJ01A1 TaxID=1317063 RepID=W2W0P7_PHYNI|nr:hypothetical protein F441_19520 [Phytophthora nicotianae CJ01A1]
MIEKMDDPTIPIASKIKERKRSKKMNGPWLKTQMANFTEARSDRTAERLASGA